MDRKKKVAILGAGASGITAIKCCNDGDLEPVCLEKTDHIGGLWYYTQDSVDGGACVMKSTVINTSKELMCFSDFPIPKEFANYLHNTKVIDYFNLYVDHFNLKKFIRFRTQVLSVKRSPDFDTTGQWTLEIKDLTSGQRTTEIYDAVMLCTGHHAEKNVPYIEGQENFNGTIVHANDYKSHQGYENKRVVVVGIGNFGGDVASELGRLSDQVYLVTRTGSWIINRVGINGWPTDLIGNSRLDLLMRKLIPYSLLNTIVESQTNARLDHGVYGLRPKHRILSAHPTINDDLPNRIICGSVIIKPNIKKIYPTSVEFEDGTVAEDIDAIILCTGYKFGLPFLEKGIIDVHDNKADIYKHVFPPHLKHSTLAAIGLLRPLGPFMPLAEMQCRWAAKVFKGQCQLPSKEEMWADIRKKANNMSKTYVSSPRLSTGVNIVSYMDELAQHVGCKPDMKKLFLSDPILAWCMLTQPRSPCQYRLHGPHPWGGARDAILTMFERARFPLETRKAEKKEGFSFTFRIMLTLVLGTIVAFLFK